MQMKLIVVLIFFVQVAFCEHESVKRCDHVANTYLLTPQGTEGSYHWNTTIQQDLTDGQLGIALHLVVSVLDINTCLPVPNAIVDLWQCDAVGICPNSVGTALKHTDGRSGSTSFLRGQQITDKNGVAVFDTIYPGWSIGHAPHIHVKVHIGSTSPTFEGAVNTKDGDVSYTGQLYFDDHLTEKIATVFPYSTNSIRRTRNEDDAIYSQENGSTMILPVQFLKNEWTEGMKTKVTLAIDPTTTPTVQQKVSKV